MDRPSQEHNAQSSKYLMERFHTAHIGIVGGGRFCLKLLRFLWEQHLASIKPSVVGVADIDPEAIGLKYAQSLGIFTTRNFRDLFHLKPIDLILEITDDADLALDIEKSKPAHVLLMDHFHARNLWDALRVENLRLATKETYQKIKNDAVAVEDLFEKSFDSFDHIIERRNARSRQIELELVENQRIQAQIIQGSTIPTFVIDKTHIVTHWNKALEALSGRKAEDVVGTNRQWAPFWQQERPTMADVILDQIDERAIEELYGSQWRKSSLIEGGYEAEIFFPQVGANGKWIWFTAAPILGPDGAVSGAIETLWDKTEDKKAEQERERHTAELSALLSIYSALSAPWEMEQRIAAALKEVQRLITADDVRIYLNETNGYQMAFRCRPQWEPIPHTPFEVPNSMIERAAHTHQKVLIEADEIENNPELVALNRDGYRFVVLVPMSAKAKRTIGVLMIAGRRVRTMDGGANHVLDLISNRIGVAIENAMLQSQYVKSEENYRSLFNNDPNPIFIVDQKQLQILDINERSLECYGYGRDELIGLAFAQLGDQGDEEVVQGLRQLPWGQSVFFPKKRHHRKDKAEFYVNINASHAHSGVSDTLIVTTTDITESVKKETQLIQASKMTTLGLMAAGMAHEINQPLDVIQICADYILKLMKKGQPIASDELSTIANDIVIHVERATGIIRHMREFAVESEVSKTKVIINTPIMDVFKVLGHQIKAHQILLDLDLDPGIPPIMAEHNRLEQVLINLVTNAIDAMDEKAQQPEHGAMLKKLTIRSRHGSGKVTVTVEDNGIGMSEEVQQKIYEPFFTTKEIGKGTGLGVSISYGIIKDYEGTISIKSQVGLGTTFTLIFPAVDHAG